MNKQLSSLLLATAVTFGAGAFIADKAHAADAVIVDTVSFRSAPNVDSTVYRYLKDGEQVDIVSKVNKYWYQVRDSSGKLGYVSSNSKYIRTTDSGSSSSNTSSGSFQPNATIVGGVNFRSGPSTSAKSYGLLKKGDQVQILSKVNNYWYKVRTSSGKTGYVSTSSKYISTGASNGNNSGSTPSIPASQAAQKVIAAGKKYLGTPYEYGSSRSNTKTFDCSDFVRQAFKDALGITLPSDSRKQGEYVKSKGNITTDWKKLQPGDIMFFMSYKGTSKSSYPSDMSNQRITHCGIYLGNGQILHTYSKESGGVRIDNIQGKHWEYRFIFGGSAL
ncbi:SH3 domain-containing protein [Paenibacillus ginsengihumi]|uniref:C40 family peptidase n=1 Tax=Paenibacillus ginsengihumi TaxID=431596 RepID=UPI00036F1088|nr:SH3 domain-containing protein [Paenibacillus ginsengihumi]